MTDVRWGTDGSVEPISETRQAADDELLLYLRRSAALVRVWVPSCIGLSLASMSNGVTFTMVATDEEIAALDGVQYLDGGPCDDGAHTGRVTTYHGDDPVDEQRWTLFARTTAADLVCSTLTLPIMDGDQVTGTVNLYAADPHAFEGYHQPLAAIFGAWVGGATANADLDFETRGTAQRAPQTMREEDLINQATGIIVSARGIGPMEARALIEDAAVRAGVEPVAIARKVIATLTRRRRQNHGDDAP